MPKKTKAVTKKPDLQRKRSISADVKKLQLRLKKLQKDLDILQVFLRLMPERAPRLRRARSIFVYWEDGRLVFHNFARRRSVFAKPVTCEVLDFFWKWRTAEEAITRFNEYSQRSVRAAFLNS